MEKQKPSDDGNGSGRRRDSVPSSRGVHAPGVDILRADILRPTPDLLTHDPAMIAGFESLGRRVILQAFEDAARGDGEARAFLTTQSDGGLLAHWVRQAALAIPLSTFTRSATACLDNPDRVRALFGRPSPSVLPLPPPSTQEDVTDE